ncbi:MAG: outer membrane beta-barrel protein [Verrucomicrobiota bacterium]|nr:outer membrane beta-barrel protein [Verrucomicrobiota bacterium]
MHYPFSRTLLAAFCLLDLAFITSASRAGGDPIDTSNLSSSDGKTDLSDGKAPILSDTGNFSRFPFRVTVAVRGGYDDNVYTTTFNKQGSGFINSSIGLSYDFGSPRTQISLQAGGGLTYYFDRPGQEDPDYNAYLALILKHKFSPRLILDANVYGTYQVEPDFSLNVGTIRRSGNFFYTLDKFTLTYLWTPRFSTATSYTFGATKYDNSAIGFYEDRIENTFGNEFRFLLTPTTTLVGEYRAEFINYDKIKRDSLTHFALAGFDHTFSPSFNVSFRGGVEFRSYDDNNNNINGGDQTSPYFEATANYAVRKDTTVTWTNRYGIDEPDVPSNPSRTSYRTGLIVTHNFTPRISSRLATFYQHDSYDGINNIMVVSPAFDENVLDIALSLRYAATRYLGFEIGYSHTEIFSDIVLREYDRNRIYAGVDFTF